MQREMSRWTWILLLLLSVCEVQAQVENRVTFLPGTFQNVNISRNETVQAVVSRIPPEVAFITLQFHTLYRNATLSYTRVRSHRVSQRCNCKGETDVRRQGKERVCVPESV
ncbi:hypothetical protein GOODEAATRI_017434 [Goodea atripinnis]|uniref:Uncharacterized protein n=1 Tax=Goodea atripinnis TaxID=208336 RepID=A0ABV0P5Q5_9TELE